MAMTRAQLAADLWGMLQRQFTEAGIANEDSTGNLKEPVDSTLLALGVDYAELATAEVTNGDVVKARILARYYGLSAVYDAVLNRVDVSKSVGAPSVSKSESKSQYLRSLENALKAAQAAADPYLPTTNESSWFVGSLDLGITQPSCEVAP